MQSQDQNSTDQVLIGGEAIQRYLGVCRWTVWNWRKNHGFPVSPLPDGRLATTKNLIEQWLMSRQDAVGVLNQSPGRPKGSKNNKQGVTGDSETKGGD